MDRKQLKTLHRRLLTAAVLCLAAPLAAVGQTLIDSIPAAELPLLNPRLRQALVERWQAGLRPAGIRNDLGGSCMLDSLSADYVRICPTHANRIEVRRVEGGFLLVSTVTDPAPDARLTRYDAAWRPVPLGIVLPGLDDFYVPTANVSLDTFRAFAMPYVVDCRIEGDSLAFTYQPRPYLPDEDFARIAPALRTAPVRIALPLEGDEK